MLGSAFAAMGAFPLPNGSRDAALRITLPAGATSTVAVSGGDGGTGEALPETCEVPQAASTPPEARPLTLPGLTKAR